MNPLTSKLNKARTALCPGAQPNSPASPERRGGGTGAGWYTRLQAALNNKTAIGFAKYLIPAILLFLLLLSFFTSCKTPATLTNDTQRHTQDSTFRATVHRIETHDTIIFGAPYIQSMVRPGGRTSLKASGDACVPGHIAPQYPSPILRISDRKITIHDTVFIARTDTLLRTQTITKPQKYIPPFYRFCTISFVSFVSCVTLTFSIHLLLRYKLPRLS